MSAEKQGVERGRFSDLFMFINYFLYFCLLFKSMVHPFIQSKLPELTEIFKKYQVKKAYLFGSAISDRFNETSDVDFLIEPLSDADEPDPVIRGEILWDLYYDLKNCLKRDVDMVTRNSLTNKYFIRELNKTSIPIYG